MNALFTTLATATATAAPRLTGGFWLPQASSTSAASVDWMFNAITWLSYFFFVLIVGIMLVFIVKYRQRGREVRAGGPTHHTALEVTWTVIPLLLSVVIFYLGFKGYLDHVTPPQDAYQIDVTAQQWSWNFRHPNGAQTTDLYVPADRPVKLVMRSEDVLHSLYIPDFRVKKDVVPGRYSTLWFNAPTPTGEDVTLAHNLFCTEYCGKDHSDMNRKVFVLAQADFDIWAENERTKLERTPTDELYWRVGPILYKRCVSCHTLDGTPGTGPSWGPHDGLPSMWERTRQGLQKFADGTSLKDLIGPGKEFEVPEDYLRNSILQPGKHLVAPYGNAMPTFQGQLSNKAIDALIGFMKHLDEFDSKGVWKKTPPPSAPAAEPKKTADNR
ncbi:MAG: cytochrome c oxidase subunit II [Phycisphaerae bacterium]|nr:cytochrome c oxidase subunit II [Phycisphaerae bacterium]